MPVIISSNTGLSSFIESHGGGLLCQPDPDDIAFCVRRMVNELESQSAMAVQLAHQFDHSKVMQSWLDLYSEVALLRQS
jgi:hypothetical protein